MAQRALQLTALTLLALASIPGSATNLSAQKPACAPLDSMAPWALVNRAWSRDTTGPRSNEALRLRLLALVKRDQAMRADFGTRVTDTTYLRELTALDSTLEKEARAILDSVGLPTRRMVGTDGSDAFMLIVQHNWSLQPRVLALAKREPPGQISAEKLAMLEDRVLVHDGKPQRFGTQWNTGSDGVFHFAPNADMAGLAERRSRAGLPPMQQYMCMLEEAGMRLDRASFPGKRAH